MEEHDDVRRDIAEKVRLSFTDRVNFLDLFYS